MNIRTYAEAVAYLESLITKERKGKRPYRLERVFRLMELLGNPQNAFKSIHIGGTSGKGSVSYMAAAILREAGYNVGLHTSPHLERINERIQVFDPDEGGVNGKEISDTDFIKLVDGIQPVVEKVRKEKKWGKPTYFETIVAMAFQYFKEKKVEVAVVEVGLGGTLDATNVLKPKVAVLTNVGLDHTHILGKTVEKIAKDKAGIIKEGIQVVTAATQKSVLDIIKERCKEKHARLTIIGKHQNVPPLGPIGEHQKINAACAISAVQKIQDTRHKIQTKHIERALQKVVIPGRFEVVKLKARSYKLEAILDGAHNPVKIQALVRALRSFFPKRKFIFIFAAKKTKDYKAMLKKLVPLAKRIYLSPFKATTDYGKRQSVPPREMKKFVKTIWNGECRIARNSEEAIQKALRAAQEGDIIVVTGSLYLVGEIRHLLTKQKK